MKTVACLTSIVLVLTAALAVEKLEPGLTAEYYNTEEGSEDFPNFPASKAPDLKRVDKDINFESTQGEWPGTHFKDFFYIRWTGII